MTLKRPRAAFWDSGAESEALAGDAPLFSVVDEVFGTSQSNGGVLVHQQLRIVNPTYSTHPWDTVYMAGLQLPGICKVLNGLTEIGIDMKKPDGADGSTITVKGYKPGKFEVSCTMWTGKQWEAYQRIRSIVWRQPHKRVSAGSRLTDVAVSIQHPALADAGIASCVVQGITFPQPADFEGGKVVIFKCVENVPAGTQPQTKTVGKMPTVKASVAQAGRDPANAVPPKPSTVKSTTGPKGPKAPPVGGPF